MARAISRRWILPGALVLAAGAKQAHAETGNVITVTPERLEALRAKRILLTGFGPFFYYPRHNPSEWLAKNLAITLANDGFTVRPLVLETKYAALEIFQRELRDYKPDIVLGFGVIGSANGFYVEEFARNKIDRALTDVEGRAPASSTIVQGGEARYRATIPARDIVKTLNANDYPATLSQDSGDFVCNYIFYHALHAARKNPGMENGTLQKVGFVHLPAPREATMVWNKMLGGADLIVRSLA